MSRITLTLTTLLLLCGCVTHSVTPKSYTPGEQLRREVLAQVKKSGDGDLITTLETSGFVCRIVRGEDFKTDSGPVGAGFDYILCERPSSRIDSAVEQAAIELDGSKPTGRIFINGFLRIVIDETGESDLEN